MALLDLLFLIFASTAISNTFDCSKLQSYQCEQVGYCYRDGSNCVKDDCLAVATGNGSTGSNTGCAAGCNVATFDDDGFTNYDECGPQPYLFICTKRSSTSGYNPESRGFSDCFAGMVLSNGVCNKDTYGDVNYCVSKTDTYYDNDGVSFTGADCIVNDDYSCNNRGVANCQMSSSCAIVNGVCVRDPCYGLSSSNCANQAGCKSFPRYSYSGSGSSYTIQSTSTICGTAVNKYGSVQNPDPCYPLRTTYEYSSEDPCNSWSIVSPLPASTQHCKVSGVQDCGITYCRADCNEAANANCTSASGIEGVTCSVKSSEGGTYCSDGREYASDNGASGVRAPGFVAIILAAAALLAAFGQ